MLQIRHSCLAGLGMENSEKTASQHHPETGSEQGLRSGSTAGDSHGETVDMPSAKKENDSDGMTPGERREELLKKG